MSVVVHKKEKKPLNGHDDKAKKCDFHQGWCLTPAALARLEEAFKVNSHQNTHLEDCAEQRRELLLKCVEARRWR